MLGAAAVVFALAAAGAGFTAAEPADSKIAYIGKDAIYTANADGSNRQLVVRGVADQAGFSWSPDGQQLAFTGGHEREEEIFVVNVDGSGLTQLTHSPADRERTNFDWSDNPVWSPDGKLIAYNGERVETDEEGSQIFLMRSDGSGRRKLTHISAGYVFYPAWSPDGSSLMFERDLTHGRVDLYAIHPNNGTRRKIAQIINEREHCACAVWSPDGTKIAYEAATGVDGKPDIYVMNPDGSAQTRLTHSPARDENPDWSPDGTQIAFYSERPGNAEIYVMNSNGTRQVRVTHDPWYNQAVRWDPAG
jgi:TolB protein